MAATVQFDEQTHAYTLGGRRLPSVTTIVRDSFPGWQASEWHLERGRATHHGCDLADQGKLDWSTVDAEIEPRIRAWEAFRRDWQGAECFLIEAKVLSRIYQFAGRCDRVMQRGADRFVVDLKNSVEKPVIVQLGGYSIGLREQAIECNGAAAVELRADGSYKAKFFSKGQLRDGEKTFLAALTVWNFKQG